MLSGTPQNSFGLFHFPDLCYDIFVKGNLQLLFRKFICSVTHWAHGSRDENVLRRTCLFLSLSQIALPPSTNADAAAGRCTIVNEILERSMSHKLFAVLAWTIRFSIPNKHKHILHWNVISASVLQQAFSGKLHGNYAHLLIPANAVLIGLKRGLPHLNSKLIREVHQRARTLTLESLTFIDTSKRRNLNVIELDCLLTCVVHALQVQHAQQSYAFYLLYQRLRWQHSISDEKDHLPPLILKQAICVFSGVVIHDAVFFRWYSMSLVFKDSYDFVGQFSPVMFAKILEEHNVDLSRLVALTKLLPFIRKAKARVRKGVKVNLSVSTPRSARISARPSSVRFGGEAAVSQPASPRGVSARSSVGASLTLNSSTPISKFKKASTMIC